MLKVIDLFSGIGGFSLGLESTGYFKTIAFVEKDKFCQKVLKKHWLDIPIIDDIRNFNGRKYEADVITGGFPCQPFSVAGKRKGTEDDRFLWNEMLRVIKEVKPKYIIGENVEGIININNGNTIKQITENLESENYKVQCLIIPASGVGAWHKRNRLWIIANSDSRLIKRENKELQTRGNTITNSSKKDNKESWWETQSEFCGIYDGISEELDKDRVVRIKALGNSIVPQIVKEIGTSIIRAHYAI